jgi:hypothetical protein
MMIHEGIKGAVLGEESARGGKGKGKNNEG